MDSAVLLKAKVEAPDVPAVLETDTGYVNSQQSSAECFAAFVTMAVALR